jgi:hypothetical protein
VPPNTVVQDNDADQYRRVQGTDQFQIRYNQGSNEFSEWKEVPNWLINNQAGYAPFREVKDD